MTWPPLLKTAADTRTTPAPRFLSAHLCLAPCSPSLLMSSFSFSHSLEPSSEVRQNLYLPGVVTFRLPQKVASNRLLGVPATYLRKALEPCRLTKGMIAVPTQSKGSKVFVTRFRSPNCDFAITISHSDLFCFFAEAIFSE